MDRDRQSPPDGPDRDPVGPPDRAAIEDLLQRGFRYALALTHDHAAAEDLLHDAWASVLSKRRVDSAPYLIRTIRNRWIDQLRRSRVVPMVALADEPVDPHVGAERSVVAADEIASALGSLSADEREVLYLNAVEGWTAAEIGALTQRSRNTILSILARARRRVGSWREAQRDLEAL